ncbi:MAG TPA: cupin domain-containing protein [Alphaproteobacteria bacterium]|jgi:mannose-6-phosphate isomerase-like protein (cupin superfamily)|nr:cupin domain-containing protein [Alphaproteobacteria bacterium]
MSGDDTSEDVKVIAQRYQNRPKTDPNARCFVISDHIVVDAEKLKSGRMYVGDAFRAVVLTLVPGQAQKTHMHPSTDHAWFIVSGTGEVTMEDGKKMIVNAGHFLVHPRNTVHGLLNVGKDNLVYVALSTGE